VAVIVADSDVLIDFLRGGNDGARRIALELTTRSLCTTAITAFEVRSGAHSARQRKAVEALLGALTVLPFGEAEARLAADLRQRLEAAGQGIGMADYLIAAICLAQDGVLLTRNRKHFERVAGLKLSGVEASG
jgi:tRNA(fMet)-specific endonuclease VapC